MPTAMHYARMITENSQQAIRSAKETVLDLLGRGTDPGQNSACSDPPALRAQSLACTIAFRGLPAVGARLGDSGDLPLGSKAKTAELDIAFLIQLLREA
jgi:hypothetical protein